MYIYIYICTVVYTKALHHLDSRSRYNYLGVPELADICFMFVHKGVMFYVSYAGMYSVHKFG